ncbi:hypothetical protein D3C78_1916090 [compost metagenome]
MDEQGAWVSLSRLSRRTLRVLVLPACRLEPFICRTISESTSKRGPLRGGPALVFLMMEMVYP